MPRTLTFPSPSTEVCPVCDEALTGLPCVSCGADLERPESAELLQVDRELHRLGLRRDVLVRLLLEPRPAAAAVPPPPPPPDRVAAGGGQVGSRWSTAELLVGLGGLSLVAAIVVFAAVAWSDLAAWAQGALLIGATGAVSAIATACSRRSLRATAESLGMVAVALAIADVEVARAAFDATLDGTTVWAVGLAIVSCSALVMGRRLALHGMVGAGTAIAFVPAVLIADAHGTSAVAWTLVAQSALGVGGAAMFRRRPVDHVASVSRTVLDLGALVSALGAAAAALGLMIDGSWFERPPVSMVAVTVFLALASLAVTGSMLAGWRRRTSAIVLVSAVGSVFAAALAFRASSDGDDVVTFLAWTGAAMAVCAAGVARADDRRPWRAAVNAAAVGVFVLTIAPSTAVFATLSAIVEVSVPPVEAGAASSLVDHLVGSSSATSSDLPDAATLAQLAAAAVAGLAGMVLGRRWGRWAVAGSALAAVVAIPIASGVSIGGTAALLIVVFAAATWRLVVRPDEVLTVVFGSAVGALLGCVSLASAPLTLATTVIVIVALALLAVRSLAARASTASLWVTAALMGGLGGLVIDALRLGSVRSGPAVLVAVVAALASMTGPAIERWRSDDESGAALCADIVVGTVLVLAALATRSADAASAVVALLGLVAGVHALRPTRRPLVAVALGSSVLLTWIRLAEADVAVVEAYTLPLAGALLLAGSLARPERHSSWVRSGSGLVVALVPTAWLAIADGDVVRTVAVVGVGAAAVLWGAVGREQAPLGVGGGILAVLAIRHLGPVADELPRYVVFAVAGVALLATGATFERRRRDLRRVRDAYRQLT